MATSTSSPAEGSIIRADEAATLPGLFRARVGRSAGTRAYMRYDPAAKDWREISWRQVGDRVDRFRLAMEREGLAKGDRCATSS